MEIFLLCVVAVVLMLLVAPAVRAHGRNAEEMTDAGHKVRRDAPEFRKPPDEGGLL
jgi:hypothetical protein